MKDKDEIIGASEQVADSKRKTLKGLVLGAGVAGLAVPSEWAKPIVSGVTLPAHAATTDSDGEGGSGTDVTTTEPPLPTEFVGDFDEILVLRRDSKHESGESMLAKAGKSVADSLAPSAHAGEISTHICITVNGDQFSASFQEDFQYFTLDGTVGDAIAPMNNECNKTFSGVDLAVNSISATGASVTITANRTEELTKNIMPGTCNFIFFCGGS
ncbi:MAG: hypothetical protein AAF402_11605 [Pseudomonadota bacterium]